MAFAARLGVSGAELGVYTFPKYRGRGLAAAVTAAWSSMPSLNQHALFYSTEKVQPILATRNRKHGPASDRDKRPHQLTGPWTATNRLQLSEVATATTLG